MTLDILCFGAHPDDAELSCSGTIAKHVALGFKAGIIDLTAGELGTRGTESIRAKEAGEAAKILGVQVRENLGMRDGFFRDDEEHQLKVVGSIRKHQPKIILANALSDRHPDHGRAASLIKTSVFLAALEKVKTSFNGVSQKPWKVAAVYHYIQDRFTQPDLIVDISDFMETRMNSINAFRSQFFNPASSEPDTYISTKEFFDSLYYRPAELGRIIGVKFGEGFVVERFPGVKNLMELI